MLLLLLEIESRENQTVKAFNFELFLNKSESHYLPSAAE